MEALAPALGLLDNPADAVWKIVLDGLNANAGAIFDRLTGDQAA